jgi:DNA modification methylase
MPQSWPADSVERRPLASLSPYAHNARTHSDAQVEQIAASMREWGWTMPILVDEAGSVIAGHGRILAARRLGLAEAPVMVARGWTEAQTKAYRLADNQLGLNAGWDFPVLATELQGLKDWDFDLRLLGFSDIDSLLRGNGNWLTDPDEAPEPPQKPVSASGQVWTLGRHRLVCGDATQAVVVSAAMNGVSPHLMVTDPPYGVDYDPAWRNEAAKNGKLAYAARRIGRITNDLRIDWGDAWKLFDGEVAYIWHAGSHASTVQSSIEDCGFEVRCQIIWAKSNYPISRGHYHWRHEPCWYAVRAGKTGHWQGARDQTTLWQINLDKNVEGGHSAQKPVECMKRPIENNSSPGQAVYDPFVGSGTTIIAAEMIGRACHAIEINPAYVDVSIMRWQAFTGGEAVLEGDGRKFNEIAAEVGR